MERKPRNEHRLRGLGAEGRTHSIANRMSFVVRPPAVSASVLVAALAAGCGCHADDPCTGWAQIGATYSVELVTRLDPMLVQNSGGRPFAAWYPHPSCGAAFDFSDGQQVSVKALARRDAEQECAECYWLWGRVDSIPTGTLEDGPPMMMGLPLFEASHQATIGVGCQGSWTFGVSMLLGGFAANYSGQSSTGTVAYRFFSTTDPTSCAAAIGGVLTSSMTCLDTWFVRVHDQGGQVVAQ